jgi:hypothetical protein
MCTSAPGWTKSVRKAGSILISQINRAQIGDGVAILGTLVPLILAVMMERPEQDYGDVLYPVV